MIEMKRIFGETEVSRLKDFIKAHIPDEDLENHKEDILQVMDATQIRFLNVFFSDLDENTVNNELQNIGMVSKIDFKEKKEILKNYIKRSLIKTIRRGKELSLLKDKTATEELPFGGFEPYQDVIKEAAKKIIKLKKRRMQRPVSTVDAYGKEKPKRTQYLDVYDKEDISYQLSKDNLPNLEELKELEYKKAKAEEERKLKEAARRVVKREVKLTPGGKISKRKPKERKKVTIYDMVDDTTVFLRKKKILTVEPSPRISYDGEEKFKLKNVDKKIKELPEIVFEPEIYESFDLRPFVEEILYTNNKIKVPKKSKLTAAEFRKRIQGDEYFFGFFLVRICARLLMKQDGYLSYSDAKLIALELRKSLQIRDFEYFYQIYLSSGEFLPNKSSNVRTTPGK